MNEFFGLLEDHWILSLIILAVVLWIDQRARAKQLDKREIKAAGMDDTERKDERNDADTAYVSSDSLSLPIHPFYRKLLTIPISAIYFLILSTVGLALLILAKIWFPEAFDNDFFWKIVLSYLVLIFSTVVIAKMSEAIEYIKKQNND